MRHEDLKHIYTLKTYKMKYKHNHIFKSFKMKLKLNK